MNGYFGKYKGICRDNNDPFSVGRIRAEVPFPLGKGKECWSCWALPCLSPGLFEVPREGDGVWIEFEAGDPNQPIWVGIWYAGRGTDADDPTLAPFQEIHAALVDRDGNNVEVDNIEQDPIADAEHKDGGHDHKAGQFYTPTRRVWMSETGHHLELNDNPGKPAYVRLFERYGRLLELTALGIVRLRSMVSAAAIGNWRDLSGTVIDGQHSLIFADEWNEDTSAPGQFIELKDMAQAALKFTSTPGQEAVRLSDFWGQYVLVRSVAGSQYVELRDKVGQTIRVDPVAGTIVVSDTNDNVITMAAGKVTIAVSASSHVNIGGESGQALATKEFVQTVFNTHTHVSVAPGSPTSPPIVPSPLTPGLDITKKQLSE